MISVEAMKSQREETPGHGAAFVVSPQSGFIALESFIAS
jgi:hypothetical protein